MNDEDKSGHELLAELLGHAKEDVQVLDEHNKTLEIRIGELEQSLAACRADLVASREDRGELQCKLDEIFEVF